MIYISRFFDNTAVMKHINALYLNREADINAKRKIINYIQNELAEGNIKNHLESFEWSSLSNSKTLLLILICIILSFGTLFLLLYEMDWILIILMILIIFLNIVSLDMFVNPKHFTLWGKRNTARNIIGEISAQNKSFKRPLIIFSSHYEKNIKDYSRLKISLFIIVNVIFIIIFTGIFIIITLFISFRFYYYNCFEFLKIISLIFGITYIFVIISVYSVKRNVDSDQLMYDISGTAILIELAKILKKEPLTNFDVIFLWTGGERFGLWGLRNYCEKNFFKLYEEYDLNISYNISIDKIGGYIGLAQYIGTLRRKKMNETLNAILRATANRMNINVSKITLPIILPYHFKLFQKYSEKFNKKFQSSYFTTFQKKKEKNLKNDTKNNIFRNNLNYCLDLCFNTLKSLDKRIE